MKYFKKPIPNAEPDHPVYLDKSIRIFPQNLFNRPDSDQPTEKKKKKTGRQLFDELIEMVGEEEARKIDKERQWGFYAWSDRQAKGN